MITTHKFSFITLVLLVSFASVNAVLFTPALPDIAKFFNVTEDSAQLTISWFLIGYALGQLIYGPLANRFGRKPALYIGVIIQIISCLLCVVAGNLHLFNVLIMGRFLLALGSGVGLKMTFTLINESYEPKVASQKIAYLMLAFAITPGLAVAFGGVLNSHYGWQSCFYALAVYGLVMLYLVSRFPETQLTLDLDALKLGHLISGYTAQLKNLTLISGGLLMGICSSYVYVFAALAPFLAINFLGMNSSQYGFANLLPPIGLLLGSITSAQLVKKLELKTVIILGSLLALFGCVTVFIASYYHLSAVYSLFLPMIIVYFGLCFILANASVLAMAGVVDKAHASAVMNFINMGFATVMVLGIAYFSLTLLLMPLFFIALAISMLFLQLALR